MRPYLQLCKPTLSFFSALSAATGFILAGSILNARLTIATSGVFILACGSCALNQYQERKTDALMKRTKNRPLPSGRITPVNALIYSLLLISSGLFLLLLAKNIIALVLGVCAVILYNGVYTYLKRKTAFASVPCAVIGAIPPAVGWFAGGGAFPDRRILAVCFLFYLWQITHFWFLFLSHGDDYKKAGFPSLTDVFSSEQLERIVFVWLLATAVASLLIPLYGLASAPVAGFLLFSISLWLIYNGVKLMSNKYAYRAAFKKMNIYILLIMLLLNIDGLL